MNPIQFFYITKHHTMQCALNYALSLFIQELIIELINEIIDLKNRTEKTHLFTPFFTGESKLPSKVTF